MRKLVSATGVLMVFSSPVFPIGCYKTLQSVTIQDPMPLTMFSGMMLVLFIALGVYCCVSAINRNCVFPDEEK